MIFFSRILKVVCFFLIYFLGDSDVGLGEVFLFFLWTVFLFFTFLFFNSIFVWLIIFLEVFCYLRVFSAVFAFGGFDFLKFSNFCYF